MLQAFSSLWLSVTGKLAVSQEYKPEQTSSLTVKLTATPVNKFSYSACVSVHYATYATL